MSLLSSRKESEVILYYYNVWKTKATPRARAWFTALEQVRHPAGFLLFNIALLDVQTLQALAHHLIPQCAR